MCVISVLSVFYKCVISSYKCFISRFQSVICVL